MASNLVEEEIQRSVREKLNSEKVKLWLPPYTAEDGETKQCPQELSALIARYSAELSLSEDVTANTIEKLRVHAIEKLAARNKLRQTSKATFKVKLAGHVPLEASTSSENPSKKNRSRVITVEFDIHRVGWDLKQVISEMISFDGSRLKLIASGKVIDDRLPLKDQNIDVKNGQIMAICLGETEAEARRIHEQMESVAETRHGAELLANKEDGGENDHYHLKITDQNGKQLQLPAEERKALTLALTLNEKGRATLKKKRYAEALLLLLEADKEFSNCRSSILDAVDNYAILCLDIVWCYLCLQNLNELPDAERRLKACDDCFRKSYGPQLERLALIRGGTGMEKALFMRLHLLQGIVSFHQGHREKATQLLTRAHSELESLQISDDDMTQVMAMGFSQLEARLALRKCDGSVPLAIEHIVRRRQEKEEVKKREKEEKRVKKLERKLGKTVNGSWVNVQLYEQLVSMGFPKGGASQALKESNNDINASLKLLQESPELLTLPDPDLNAAETPVVTDEMVAQVTALGFHPEAALAALHRFRANPERAVEELLRVGGVVPFEWVDAVHAATRSASSSSSQSSTDGSPEKSPEEEKREKEAIERIVKDIPEEEEEHLDLTLEQEAEFLSQYLALLKSLPS